MITWDCGAGGNQGDYVRLWAGGNQGDYVGLWGSG